MARITTPIEKKRDHYTVIVVGSGYRGAIAVAHIVGIGQHVCLLERRKEFQPG
jgi:cholesterol oxidase